MHRSELRVWLSSIAKRINIGIAPRKQQAIKICYHVSDKIPARDQSNVNR
jgi:hypothetical protein